MDLKLLELRRKKLEALEKNRSQQDGSNQSQLNAPLVQLAKQVDLEDSDKDEVDVFLKVNSDNSDLESQEDDNSVFEKRMIFEKEGSQLFHIYSDDEVSDGHVSQSSYESDDDDQEDDESNGFQENVIAQSSQQQQVDEKGKVLIDKLRDYQIEIFKNSYEKNSIIYLETGTGKTLVATMLIYYFFKRQRALNQKKKIIFIANTVQLVEQQFAEIKERLNLVAGKMESDLDLSKILDFGEPNNYRREFRDTNIAKAHGNFKDKESLKNQERYSQAKWLSLKQDHDIFVMMGQVLLNGLRRAYISLDEIDVIIFDECHHTRSDHPYNHIMSEFYHFYKQRNKNPLKYQQPMELPRIYGLTASPVLDIAIQDYQKHNEIMVDQIQILCSNLDSQFARYDMKKAKEFIKEIKEDHLTVECYSTDGTREERALQIMEEKILGMKLLDYLEQGGERFNAFLQFYKRLYEFGIQHMKNLSDVNRLVLEDLEKILQYSLQLDAQLGKYAVNLFLNDVNNVLRNTKQFQDNQQEMLILQKLFAEETKSFSDLYGSMDTEDALSPKFQYFFETLEKTMKLDLKVFEQYRQESKFDEPSFNMRAKKEQLRAFMKQNQSMVLIFVEEKIVIKYLREVLKKRIHEYNRKNDVSDPFRIVFRCENVFCLTGQTNVYDKRKKNYNSYIQETTSLDGSDQEKAFKAYEIANQKKVQKSLEEEAKEMEELDEMKKKINDFQRTSQNLKLVQLDFEIKNQADNIEAFRKKEIQIILSTSVTEEGFDIPSCNLVISFNQINNLKSFVQIKGRARKENSRFLMLARDTAQKDKIEFNVQRYKDIIQKIKEIAPEVKIGDPIQEESYKYRIVKKSGAILNTNWSTMLFHQYANFLSYDRDWNIKGPYFYYTHIKGVGYDCQIILPPSAEKRRYKSRPQKTKKIAKREACFEAIIYLKKLGIFDENLRSLQLQINQNLNNQYEAAYEDKQDKELQDILEKYTQTEIDHKQKFKKIYFYSIMGDALSASIFKAISLKSTWKMQLYRLSFSNPQGHIPQNVFQGNFNSELGLIHFTDIPIKEKQRYLLEATNTRIFSEMEFIGEYDMDLTLYERLQKISQFLNSVALNKDIEFYAELSQEPMNPQGRLFKEQAKVNNKYLTYKFISPQDKINTLLTLITPSQEDPSKFQLNWEHLEKIELYITYMKEVYIKRNKTKLSDEEKKQRREKYQNQDQTIIVNNSNSEIKEFNHDYRIKPHYSCVNFFKLDSQSQHKAAIEAKEKLVLQCTRSGKHLNRFLLLDCKQISEHKQEDLKTEDLINKFKRKKEVIEKEEVSFKLNDDHAMLKLYLFEKQYLRKKVNLYLNRVENIKMDFDSKEYSYFPNVFTIFPMNVDLLIKLSIFHKCLLYQIRDTFAIHHFQIFKLPELFKASAPRKSQKAPNNETQIASYVQDQMEHFICKHSNEVLPILQEKNVEFAKIKDSNYENNSNIQNDDNDAQSLGKLQPIIDEKYELYLQDAKNAKLSELIKSFTSKEYSSNDKHSNLERYEFLGDTVLKCLATTQTYFAAKTKMENELHVRRAGIIFNKNLTRIAIKKLLFKYILADKMNHAYPLGIVFECEKESDSADGQIELPDEYDKADNQADGICVSTLKPFYRRIKGKTFADCVESIIGMFYWEKKDMNFCQFLLYSLDVLEKPDLTFSHIFKQRNRQLEEQSYLFKHLAVLEQKLGYKFQNASLLFQSLTLSNFEAASLNAIRSAKVVEKNSEQEEGESLKSYNFSNQRLEFLGDAVLDMIVVEHLFQQFPLSEPGDLTEMKRSVVQNKTLCLVNLDKELYKYVIGDLDRDIVNLKKIISHQKKFQDDIQQMYSEEYDQSLIKTLGDVVESIIGAIFIDNKLDYIATKKIVLKLMSPYINTFPAKAKAHGFNDAQVLHQIFQQEVEVRKVKKSVQDGKTKFEFRNRTGDVLYLVYAKDKNDAIDQATIERQKQQVGDRGDRV